jgi:ribonuclease E
MNDKPSARVTARPPMPSIAPPTDDIDAEWGADELPAAAPLPKLASPSVAPPASPSVAPAAASATPRPSSPAPHLATPLPRPPSPSRPPSAPRRSSVPPAPLEAPAHALRKQTLLGVAPPPEPPPPTLQASTPAEENPLRKQTLLGVAPPPTPPADEPSGVAAPAVAASDAPTTVEVEPRTGPVISWPPPEPASSALDAGELATKPSRARWLVPLGVAAALGFAVGAKHLAGSPESAPPPVAALKASPAEEKPKAELAAVPAGDAAASATPTPVAAPSVPVEAAAPSAAPAPSAEPAGSAAPPSGDVLRIQVNSDPPGARLFWKGKPVGTTPFVLELAAGEKHAYEMGMPGYNTRKVVVDGTKTEINIGLKPEPGTFIGAKPRKP